MIMNPFRIVVLPLVPMKAMAKASLLLLALLGAGCSSDADDALVLPVETIAPDTTVQTQTTALETTVVETTIATTTTLSPEDAVRAAFEQFAEERINYFLDVPGGTDALELVTHEHFLQQIVDSFEARFEDGLVGALPADSVLSSEILSISFQDDSTATVIECFVDDTYFVNSATGEDLFEDPETYEDAYKVVRIDGKWLVRERVIVSNEQGVVGCAV